jgi:transcriptional regulator with PAS, ATPase and Fis domain
MKHNNIAQEIIESIFNDSVEHIFNQIPLPIAFVDADCRVVSINNAFRDYFGLELSNIKGKYAWEVDPNAKLPEILKTDKPEIGVKHRFLGKDCIVHRIPIHANGQLNTSKIFISYTSFY